MQNQIPKNWQKVKMGEIVEFVDGDRGVNYPKNNELLSSGYCLFLNTKNVPSTDFNFSSSDNQFINKEKDIRLRKGKLKRGDFVLTTRGTVGNFAYYSDSIPYENIRINSGMVILRNGTGNLDSGFLKQFLNSSRFRIQVLSLTSGSAQPQLPIRDLSQLTLELPPFYYQKKISVVLSAFDNKIEMNNKIEKTLEEIARAIFKEWFVDFRFPGYEETEFVDSELGKIPKGWVIGKLEDICEELNSGGTPSTINNKFYDGNIDWFSTKELNDGFLLNSEKKISNDGLNCSSAKIFPKGSIVMAIYAAPTVGRLGILTKEATFNQAACGFNANIQVACNEFIYLFLLTSRAKLNNMANGVAQQNLNVGLVKNFPVLVPDTNTMSKFKLIIQPIFDKILSNSLENQRLVALRDLLLPKLMRGEIRV